MKRYILLIVLSILVVFNCNLEEIPDDDGTGGSGEVSFAYTISCDVPLEILFNNTSALQGDAFSWDFGDEGSAENTSTEEHPSHIYSGTGVFNVELTVESGGTQSTFTMDVIVEAVTFERSFGGGVMDSATAVTKAHDGGYFITGHSKSKGNDILIYKTNLCGEDLIYSSVGSAGSHYGYSICQTNGGGYLIAGEKVYFGSQAYLVLLNSSGNIVQALEENQKRFYSAIQLPNDDIIIAGSQYAENGIFSFYDSYLYRTDANLLSIQEFLGSGGGSFTNEYFQVVELSDQSVAAVGSLWTGWGNRIHFSSANYSFGVTWQYSIAQIVGDNSIVGTSLAKSEDDGFVITGWYNNIFDPDPPATYLKKISETGAELWESDFVSGTGIIGQNEPTKVIATSDGGFLILGNHKLDATPDIFILKTDPNGNYLWDRSFGGSGKDIGNDIIEVEDKGFVIVGYTESFNTSGETGNVYIIKTDENGQML